MVFQIAAQQLFCQNFWQFKIFAIFIFPVFHITMFDLFRHFIEDRKRCLFFLPSATIALLPEIFVHIHVTSKSLVDSWMWVSCCIFMQILPVVLPKK
jgi:hypothetical protein